MEQNELVTVYTLTNPVVAELIRSDLESEGIRCILAGIEQASAAGLPGTEILVQVQFADSSRARELIQQHDVVHDDGEEPGDGEMDVTSIKE